MKNVLQGDIWWINPTPKIGSEQRGKRPALVIQNNIANHYLQTTIIAIISSSGKTNMPEMISLEEKHGLKKGSYADFAQIFTIDKRRLLKKTGRIDSQKWNEVQKAIGSIFMNTITAEDSATETNLEMFINNPSFDFSKDELDLYE